jgi:hypothetical protein
MQPRDIELTTVVPLLDGATCDVVFGRRKIRRAGLDAADSRRDYGRICFPGASSGVQLRCVRSVRQGAVYCVRASSLG